MTEPPNSLYGAVPRNDLLVRVLPAFEAKEIPVWVIEPDGGESEYVEIHAGDTDTKALLKRLRITPEVLALGMAVHDNSRVDEFVKAVLEKFLKGARWAPEKSHQVRQIMSLSCL